MSANRLDHLVTGLTNAVDYEFTVTATNTNGTGAAASFPIVQPGVLPYGPASATASTFTISSAIVSWVPSTIANEGTIKTYVVEGIPSSLAMSSFNILEYTYTSTTIIDNLSTNSYYQFIVRGINDTGYSIPRAIANLYVPSLFTSGQALLATRIGGAATYTESRATADSNGNFYVLYKTSSGSGASHSIYNYTSAPTGGGAIGTTLHATITGGDRYLVKYNSDGVCQWATIIPNSTGDSENFGVMACPPPTCDAAGNVYVVGNISPATLNLYSYSSTSGGAINTSLTATLAGAGSGRNMYLLKYNTSGTLTGATRASIAGGSSPAVVKPYISADANNNIYASFFASGQNSVVTVNSFTSISSGTVNVTSYGTYTVPNANYSAVAIKYDESLAVQWVTAVENVIADTVWAQTAHSADSMGRLSIIGRVASGTTVTVKSFSAAPSPPGSAVTLSTYGTLSFTSDPGVFIVQYNSFGAAQWSARTLTPGNYIIFPSVSIDTTGNVYTTYGAVNGGGSTTLTLYGAPNTSTPYGTLGNAGGISTIITKYNSSGTIQWVTKIEASGGSQVPFDSRCDINGNMYIIIGYDIAYGVTSPELFNYTSAPSGGGAIGVTKYGNIAAVGDKDTFFVKYDANGSVVWASRVAGTAAELSGGIAVSGDNMWVTGTYASNPITVNSFSAAPVSQGNVTLDAFGTLADVNTGAGTNLFLAKYKV